MLYDKLFFKNFRLEKKIDVVKVSLLRSNQFLICLEAIWKKERQKVKFVKETMFVYIHLYSCHRDSSKNNQIPDQVCFFMICHLKSIKAMFFYLTVFNFCILTNSLQLSRKVLYIFLVLLDPYATLCYTIFNLKAKKLKK